MTDKLPVTISGIAWRVDVVSVVNVHALSLEI